MIGVSSFNLGLKGNKHSGTFFYSTALTEKSKIDCCEMETLIYKYSI
ncbi:hypothetical protein SAMN06298216_2561 [Spirosomataceae bacterium TFI 002]|nr:hypothetical protein SAMN06298216_2561 [Spirosomataceae bacterium TFI 002]